MMKDVRALSVISYLLLGSEKTDYPNIDKPDPLAIVFSDT
jgi:hypothetical protein